MQTTWFVVLVMVAEMHPLLNPEAHAGCVQSGLKKESAERSYKQLTSVSFCSLRQLPTSCQQLQHMNECVSQELRSIANLICQSPSSLTISVNFYNIPLKVKKHATISSSLVKAVIETDLHSS